MNKVMMVVLASCMCVMNLYLAKGILPHRLRMLSITLYNKLFVCFLLSYGSPIAVQSNTIATEGLDIKEVTYIY